MPRITRGVYEWTNVVLELTARGFQLPSDADILFNEQTCRPSWRNVRVIRSDGSSVTRRLGNIMSGSAVPCESSKQQRKNSSIKRSETIRTRALGQKHVWEAAAFKAYMLHIDPPSTKRKECWTDVLVMC